MNLHFHLKNKWVLTLFFCSTFFLSLSAQWYDGWLDGAWCPNAGGWAKKNGQESKVDIYIDGKLIAPNFGNNRSRDDVSPGFKGYEFTYPDCYRNGQNHTIEVKHAGTTTQLNGSPKTFNCGGGVCVNPPTSGEVQVSTLNPIGHIQGWGDLQRNKSVENQTLKVGGQTFATGLGTHSNSSTTYYLDGKYKFFRASIGRDDEADGCNCGAQKLQFVVKGDGQTLYTSPLMGTNDGPLSIEVDVTGKKQIELVTLDGGDQNWGDHADWGNARLVVAGNSNNSLAKCATVMPNLSLLQQTDPNAYRRIMEFEEHIKRMPTIGTRSLDHTVIVPVVFHVVHNYSDTEEGTGSNISKEQIQSQIDVLNEDFSALNADKVNIPQVWRSLHSDTKIRFVLADVAPNGVETCGITRTRMGNNNGFNIFGGDDDTQRPYPRELLKTIGGIWDKNEYLNIWVCNNTNSSILGLATFPNTPEDNQSGIILHYRAVGRYASNADGADLGRTATHEVGHWLNLIHLWGNTTANTSCTDADPSCTDADEVYDTPKQFRATTAPNPTYPRVDECTTSGDGIMFMNFMDYTADQYLTMFTSGQVQRMCATFDNGMGRQTFRQRSLSTTLSSITTDHLAKEVPITVNSPFNNWRLISQPDWATLSRTDGTGNQDISINISSSCASRSGEIRIGGNGLTATITINQTGPPTPCVNININWTNSKATCTNGLVEYELRAKNTSSPDGKVPLGAKMLFSENGVDWHDGTYDDDLKDYVCILDNRPIQNGLVGFNLRYSGNLSNVINGWLMSPTCSGGGGLSNLQWGNSYPACNGTGVKYVLQVTGLAAGAHAEFRIEGDANWYPANNNSDGYTFVGPYARSFSPDCAKSFWMRPSDNRGDVKWGCLTGNPSCGQIAISNTNTGNASKNSIGASDFDVTESPNPVRDNASLDILLNKEEAIHITVINSLGKEVVTRNIEGVKGNNNLLLDLKALPTGLYLISVRKGEETIAKKIMKIN
jgi:hypothetical protein